MMRRLRRWGKWAGVATFSAIALVWFTSGWYGAGTTHKSATETTYLRIDAGAIRISRMLFVQDQRVKIIFVSEGPTLPPGFSFSFYGRRIQEPLWSWAPRVVGQRNMYVAVVPLWIPMLLVAIPTAWLWRRDRRHSPGCCPRCGYDLSGTPSGICPECGRAQKKADEARAPSA